MSEEGGLEQCFEFRNSLVLGIHRRKDTVFTRLAKEPFQDRMEKTVNGYQIFNRITLIPSLIPIILVQTTNNHEKIIARF